VGLYSDNIAWFEMVKPSGVLEDLTTLDGGGFQETSGSGIHKPNRGLPHGSSFHFLGG
jgi:hypothetical protein